MRWARTPYLSRFLAGLVIASMMPALFVLPSTAASGTTFGSYSRWIRAQLRVPADEAFETALSRASDTRPASLAAFIEAFLEAYEEANPGISAAPAFTDLDLSDDALITYLQRRYTQIGDEGVLPRVYLTTAVASSPLTGQGHPAAVTGGKATLQAGGHDGSGSAPWERTIVTPLRSLSSENPLGP